MRAIQIAGILILAMFASVSVADTVFRSVDEEGKWIFSDRPSENGADEAIEVDIKHSVSARIEAKKSADEEIAAAAAIRENHEQETLAEQQEVHATVAEQRAANCTKAKSRQEKYNNNRKLYKPLANGEREYLSSDELDAARAEAARTVAEWCS